MITTTRPALALTLHPDAPMTVGWTLWLSYCGGVGEIVGSGRAARTLIAYGPMRRQR